MIYTFVCPKCKAMVELSQPMEADHTPPQCECGNQTNRVYNNRYNCDELRATKYIDPKTMQEVKDHGRVFDPGMGAYYSSWSERKRLMKEKGLQEFGPEAKDPRGNVMKSSV